jgi:serine/threonine protein kinase
MNLITFLRKILRKGWCKKNLKTERELFGKYRLIKPLGQGGYFNVWLAHHLNLDIPVVMRFLYGLNKNDAKHFTDYVSLFSETSGKEINWEEKLFKKESRILGGLKKHTLTHPYGERIQKIDDSQEGTFWSPPFMVTEAITGDDLSNYIGQERYLSLPTIEKIAEQIAEGLSVLHSFPDKPLVHRDLNPRNIILQESGDIKIIDFGACLSLDECVKENLIPNSIRFRSLEQWTGIVGPEADTYSWALIMYSLLTRELPFKNIIWDREKTAYDNIVQERKKLAEIIKTEELPDIREKVPDLGDDLGSLIMRNLDKNPENRCRDGSELLEEIRLCGTIKNYLRKKKPIKGLAKIVAERKIKPLLEIIPPGECPMVVENKKWTCMKQRASTNMFWFGLLDLGYQETRDEDFIKYARKSVEAFEPINIEQTHSHVLMSRLHCLAIADFKKYEKTILHGVESLINRFVTFDYDEIKITNSETEEKEIIGFRNLRSGYEKRSSRGFMSSRKIDDNHNVFVDFVYPFSLFHQKLKQHISKNLSEKLNNIAGICLHTMIEFFQRDDGSFGEGGGLNLKKASLKAKVNIGYGNISHCARSNFRILYSGAEYSLVNNDTFVLKQMIKLADYCCSFLSNQGDIMPRYDFVAPENKQYPDSACVIGVSALKLLAKALQQQNTDMYADKIQKYLSISDKILNASLKSTEEKGYFCIEEPRLNPKFHQALMMHSYRDDYRKDTSLIVSDFEFLKNLIKLKKKNN